MKKVNIIGASGSLASNVIDAITNAELTLFVRNKSRLSAKVVKDHKVVEGDAMKYDSVTNAIAGHDIVYINLAGNLELMGKNIVQAMKETGVKRIIAINSIGIYDKPLKSVQIPCKALADVVESSGLVYTILRPDWFTSDNEVNYMITHKGEPEAGTAISKMSIASFVASIIDNPELHKNAKLGISKPN
jgi:uncharacterized protein YbjT (DUF2867 family)